VKFLFRFFFRDSFFGSAIASARQSGIHGTVPMNEDDEIFDLAPILPRPDPVFLFAFIGLGRPEPEEDLNCDIACELRDDACDDDACDDL